MKVTFKLSSVVASIIAAKLHKPVIEACEAELNRRTVVSQTESGLRNVKADMVAKSSATVEFTQNQSVVTAFIEYAQADVGTVDKAVAKLRKLTGKDTAIAGTLELPASYKGHDIAGWIAKLEAKSKAKPEVKPETKPAPAAPVAA